MPVIIGDKQLTTPIADILKSLQGQCQALGNGKLRSVIVKPGGVNAVITCPHHKGGQEHTPACNVLLEDRAGVHAGTAYCFACGYKAGPIKLVADCLDCSYQDAEGWLLTVSDYDVVEEDSIFGDFIQLPKQAETATEDNYPMPTDEELKSYENIHQYMFKRKLTPEVIMKFEVGYDPKTDALTFPVRVGGKCLFVAKRCVHAKRFLMPKMSNKPIYGLDYIDDGTIIVCESVINCLTCWAYGKQAVALFGTGSQTQIETLNNLPNVGIILALDGDAAGHKGTERIAAGLHNKVVSVLEVPAGKDINDLSREEFSNLREIFL